MTPPISCVPLEQMDERMKAALAYAKAVAWGSHQYMAGTSASMAPGFETAEHLAVSKADPNYWAANSQA